MSNSIRVTPTTPLYSNVIGPVALTTELREEYLSLWETARVTATTTELGPQLSRACSRAVLHRDRYRAVSDPLAIPWIFVAAVHALETSQQFDRHLHNGDPLAKRTVQVPAGRPKLPPKSGSFPYTWEESAEDALRGQKLDQWDDWSVPGLLFQFERYNGFGYRRRGIHTPYLWSGTQHYRKGKFVADRKYDPEAVSKQLGCATIVLYLQQTGAIEPLLT